jgi:chlorite dismutase
MDIQRAKPTKTIDLSEKGRDPDGRITSLDRRLFMQFFAFGSAGNLHAYSEKLEQADVQGVLYEDLQDPNGIGLLTFSENPDYFLTNVRSILNDTPFNRLMLKPEFSMLGRTYSLGYEEDLERTLIQRPIQRVTDPSLSWAIWYPVRRSGKFEGLTADEQRVILMEHGGIGRAYGQADLAYDVRLACFGMDKHDNDFIIGLLGHELHPLSNIVERMRKTKQTSQYLSNLGPFFIGKVVWQVKQVTE